MKTSAVDLSLVDSRQWTVLHHLASPIDIGTFDNLDVLKLLMDNGAVLTAKDNAGLTPLDLALMNGGEQLSRGIQKLLEKAESEWVSAEEKKTGKIIFSQKYIFEYFSVFS